MAKAPAKTTKKKSFKKKEKKHVPYGTVHIQASFNNTIVTFTDPLGNVLAWSSSGSLGFRGSREGNSLCRAAGLFDRSQQGEGNWASDGRSSSGGSRLRARISGSRAGDGRYRSPGDQRCDTYASQRLPSSEKAPRLTIFTLGIPQVCGCCLVC